MTVTKWGIADITMHQLDWGIHIQQGDRQYVARDWYLTDEVRYFAKECVTHGLPCIIRENHPMKNIRTSKGANFIGFSRTPYEKWAIVIDEWCPKAKKPGDKIQRILINKNFGAIIDNSGIRNWIMKSNIAHIHTSFKDTPNVLRSIIPHIESVEQGLGSRHWEQVKSEIGFVNEALLESWMVDKWDELKLGTELTFLGNQMDYMDIVAVDEQRGRLVVFELKRAVGDTNVIDQIEGYLNGAARKYANGRTLVGCVVAKNFTASCMKRAEKSSFPILLFKFFDSDQNLRVELFNGSWD